ncbi:MAG: BamA/TamA family outer membrane protein [Acidobacteria bacterium]|nr:BamA/TamA family outer membrane protein [Acidobacteriota bacterium]
MHDEKKIFLMLALLMVFAVCALTLRAAEGGDFLGRRVTSVRVLMEGAQGGATAEMQALLEVAAGQTYSPVRIHDSLIALYRSGLISEARVEAEAEGAAGVALTFVVKPQARIDAIVFEGTPIFSTSEIRSRLKDVEPGAKLSSSAISRGTGELIAYYSARGFNDARVSADVRLDQSGRRATVIYTITPGEQARIANYTLNIVGPHLDLSNFKHALVAGQLFTQASVGDEMERLRQEHLKNDYLMVRVSNKITPGADNKTVNVMIDVEPGPKVEVDIQGLPLDDKTKRQILPFYTQGGVDEFTIEEARLRLLDYAQRKGYFFAAVTSPPFPDSTATLSRLVYQVETGRKFKLSEINFEGITAIDSRDLLPQLKSKTAVIIPYFGFSRGFTSDEFLRQDANLIAKRLKELGYRRATVVERRGVTVDGDNLIITFSAVQGPRTYIQDIDVRGNNLLTTDELRGRLSVQVSDPLVANNVRGGADKLQIAYTNRGYATAEVSAEIVDLGNVDGQDRVRLIYDVVEGNRVRISDIITRGAGRTDVKRLERDFYLFKRGDWLNADKILDTERVLYDTNAMGSVSINSETIGQAPDGIEDRRVTVDIVEAKPNLLIYGFGFQFSRDPITIPGLAFMQGFKASAQITNTNLFGKLYSGSLQTRIGRDEVLGQATFQNPRPFGTNFPLLISVFGRRLAEKSFRSDRYTAVIQAERRLSDKTIVYGSYNFERISLADLQVSPEEIARNRQAIRLGRIGPSFARDSRDNAFDPSNGTFTLGSIYLASRIFGGNEQFIKMLVEHSRYYKVKKLRDTVYSVSGRLGLARPYGGKDTLPISERFFGGGSRDLRGFGFEEAGPKDPVTGRPIGGNAVFVINHEFRFPLYGAIGGTLFSDIGNVYRRVKDISPRLTTVTFGIGVRIKTPIGPVRFDVGSLVLNRPAGAPLLRGHFTFGQTF